MNLTECVCSPMCLFRVNTRYSTRDLRSVGLMWSLFSNRCVKFDWYTVARFVVMDGYQKTWIILDVFFAQIFKQFDDERTYCYML